MMATGQSWTASTVKAEKVSGVGTNSVTQSIVSLGSGRAFLKDFVGVLGFDQLPAQPDRVQQTGYFVFHEPRGKSQSGLTAGSSRSPTTAILITKCLPASSHPCVKV